MEQRTTGSSVVARFLDGRVLKGTTHDFAPQKPFFHLSIWGEPNAKAITVPIGALKALFFVKSYQGDPKRIDDNDLASARGQGRKVMVTFNDGEVICGFTSAYSKDKAGFFLIPADAKGNNARVFVLTAAVRKVLWADATAPAASPSLT
jgi:hypothetical protein